MNSRQVKGAVAFLNFQVLGANGVNQNPSNS